MAEALNSIRGLHMVSDDRLRESVIAFFLCGTLIGGLASAYEEARAITVIASAIGVSACWWRLNWLNDKERK